MSKLSALSSMGGPVNRNSGLTPTFLAATPSVTSMYESEGSVTFTVTSFAIPNNTTVYYTINQVSGTISTTSFTSGSLSGSFVMNNNNGSFKLYAALEDGNNTDDTFNISIRLGSITNPVLLTSPNVKIVDLTSYNSALNLYNVGYGGLTMTYSIAATSSAAGNKTTVTFQGTTITANGGGAGVLGATSAGGTFSGGDGGYAGGTGQLGSSWRGVGGAAGGSGTAGGGGAPGGNNGGSPGQYAGGWVGTTSNATTNTRLNGLLNFMTAAGWSFNMAGPATSPTTFGYAATGSPGNYLGGGGGGYAATQNLSAGNTAYQRAYGGPGGQLGGGGGGAGVSSVTNYLGQYTYASQAGGTGGPGGVVVQYNGGTTGAFITSGTSRTIPTGVRTIKVWAIGGGGGGKSSTSAGTVYPSGTVYGGKCGGGGGGGGVAWKTWTYALSSPTKPPL